MAHFAYIHGATAADWPIGTVVTPQNFADFDSGRFRSINGDEGGSWAPSSVITIGGSGMSLTGNFVTAGNTTIGNATTGSLIVKQSTQFDCDVVIGIGGANTLIVNAPTSRFNGDVTLGSDSADTLTIEATPTVNADLLCTAKATIRGNTTIGLSTTNLFHVLSTSTLDLAYISDSYLGYTPGTGGCATLAGDLISAVGGGRIALSTVVVPDADYASSYAHNYIYNSVTDNRNLTLTIASPRVGTEFWVHIIGTDGSGNVTLIINGVTYGTTVGTSTQLNAKVVYTGSTWHIVTF